MFLWIVACRPPELSDPSSTVPPFDTGSGGVVSTVPLGPSIGGGTLTFRVRSERATRLEVWRYTTPVDAAPVEVLALTRNGDPNGDLWEGSTPWSGDGDPLYYGLRAWGPNWTWDESWTPGSSAGWVTDVDGAGNRFDPNKLLLDPYGRESSHDPGQDWGRFTTGERRDEDSGPSAPKSVIVQVEPLARPPRRPPQDQVVYEVHLRGFTMLDPDVSEALRGTYAGAAMRAAELADLGVTAIELLPVHETNNDQNELTADASGDNYWGYSTYGFFAPDRRYAADQGPGGPTAEFRSMVEAFHAEGVEVILDVVYNHTAEGGTWGNAETAPLLSFRGLDNAAYYELADGGRGYRGDNGVGPNWNATHPIARDLVIDSLRYWSDTLGVDGFRFDLAPILNNTCATDCFSYGRDDPESILVRAAELDVLLIAEPWGATGEAYQGGNLPAGWAEWNDGYRDAIRADQNALGVVNVTPRQLVDALSGSQGRYGDDGRSPWSSVAYVVSHDGFTLADLYRCDAPDNDQEWPYGPSGGGSNNNLSWSQGGDEVQQRRVARSAIALMAVSAGIPMIVGGDELLRSQACNNNPYNLDSVATWIDWDGLRAENAGFEEFTRRMFAVRAAHPELRPSSWTRPVVYDTDGHVASDGYLDDPTRHAFALGYGDGSLLVLYNGWSDGVTFALPASPSGERWLLVGDTHEWLEAEHNVLDVPGALPDDQYLLGERSVAVLTDGG
ncbi:MAG: alpha-amylase family glycosyl hydrolase [Myxococcota bacterium]